MKALTALSRYLSILLEYINLFQSHSKKDNFSEISFWEEEGGGFSSLDSC